MQFSLYRLHSFIDVTFKCITFIQFIDGYVKINENLGYFTFALSPTCNVKALMLKKYSVCSAYAMCMCETGVKTESIPRCNILRFSPENLLPWCKRARRDDANTLSCCFQYGDDDVLVLLPVSGSALSAHFSGPYLVPRSLLLQSLSVSSLRW